MLVEIPPKMSVSSFVGFLIGRTQISMGHILSDAVILSELRPREVLKFYLDPYPYGFYLPGYFNVPKKHPKTQFPYRHKQL